TWSRWGAPCSCRRVSTRPRVPRCARPSPSSMPIAASRRRQPTSMAGATWRSRTARRLRNSPARSQRLPRPIPKRSPICSAWPKRRRHAEPRKSKWGEMTSRVRIAHLAGSNATIQNTPALVTSNKARAKHGLPLLHNKDGSPPRFDALRPQRLAAPTTVYVEQFSAHPLEADAAELYGPPDGYVSKAGVFGQTRTDVSDKPVYKVELSPDDGLYMLPYMGLRADGQAWDMDGTSADADRANTRQPFFP